MDLLQPWMNLPAAGLALYGGKRLFERLRLSMAKHPSLRGHPKTSRKLARFLPSYSFSEDEYFTADGAPREIAQKRARGFDTLEVELRERAPLTHEASQALEEPISDVKFTNAYRVPFQFRDRVRKALQVGCVAGATDGVRVRDLDGNWSYDLFGSYGVNVFGTEFYKRCIDRGANRARDLGPILGLYHPVIADNVQRLREISGLEEVSFHMSGTEAVMQAVRLARYHTKRRRVVVFCGAYHGWWDGVQPGVGSQRRSGDVFTLKEDDETTLKVLATRKDIACALINPLQALNPNGSAPSDGSLLGSSRTARFDKEGYSAWLRRLREVCEARGIVLIFDEVFLGFRVARGGAQEYFDVRADLVTYGKTLGGGLPVGVLCGKSDLMKRFREDRPADVCFARGTFNSHPYVMTAMNEVLHHIDTTEVRKAYDRIDEVWNARREHWNERFRSEGLPVEVANMTSVFTTLYRTPSRYNWMYQYYLRAEGLALPWIGTGRYIFSHDYTDADFEEVVERSIRAARRMEADGFWWKSEELTDGAIKKRVRSELWRAFRSR